MTTGLKTERVVVQLGKLHPNPFKKHIQDGKLNEERVARLEESIDQSGFWDGLVARRNGNGFEIGFGHHRHEAAVNKLGKEYKTSILVGNYSDEDMARMMINENSTNEGASIPAQADSVVFAREYLIAHPKACKDVSSRSETKGRPHEHGSVRCITAFLGEQIWSRPKVQRLLEESGLEDKTIIEDRNRMGSSRPSKGRVGHETASKLGQLPKPMQHAFVRAIKKAKVGLPGDLINDAIDVAVEKVGKGATTRQQHRAAIAAVKAAETQERKNIALRNSKEVDDWLERMTMDLMNWKLPDRNLLRQAIGLRENSKDPETLEATVSALRDLAKQLEEFADQLEAPPQKKLA